MKMPITTRGLVMSMVVRPTAWRVSHEQSQSGQRRGTDGETFSDSGGGVTQRVQFIGDFAGFGSKFGHFGDAARVIGDGAVRVNGHGGADGGKHANRGDTDSINARHLVGHVDGDADAGHRQSAALKANGDTGDDNRGRARGGLAAMLCTGLPEV